MDETTTIITTSATTTTSKPRKLSFSISSLENIEQLKGPLSASSLEKVDLSIFNSKNENNQNNNNSNDSSDSTSFSYYDNQNSSQLANSKRDADFHELFPEINRNDRLIDDFACALQKEILLQGRLYLSQHNLVFYCNIFGWTERIIVPFKDIKSLDKRAVAGIIQNAIQVTTIDKSLFFASFLYRDYTFDILFKHILSNESSKLNIKLAVFVKKTSQESLKGSPTITVDDKLTNTNDIINNNHPDTNERQDEKEEEEEEEEVVLYDEEKLLAKYSSFESDPLMSDDDLFDSDINNKEEDQVIPTVDMLATDISPDSSSVDLVSPSDAASLPVNVPLAAAATLQYPADVVENVESISKSSSSGSVQSDSIKLKGESVDSEDWFFSNAIKKMKSGTQVLLANMGNSSQQQQQQQQQNSTTKSSGNTHQREDSSSRIPSLTVKSKIPPSLSVTSPVEFRSNSTNVTNNSANLLNSILASSVISTTSTTTNTTTKNNQDPKPPGLIDRGLAEISHPPETTPTIVVKHREIHTPQKLDTYRAPTSLPVKKQATIIDEKCDCDLQQEAPLIEFTLESCTLENLWDVLYSHESSTGGHLFEFLISQGTKDTVISEWSGKEKTPKITRTKTFTKKLTNPLGPSSTKCEIKETVNNYVYGKYFCVESITRTPDVPSGNSFTSNSYMCAKSINTTEKTTSGSGSGSSGSNNNVIFVSIYSEVVWTKSSWVKFAVDKAVPEGIKAHYKLLIPLLQEWVVKLDGGKLPLTTTTITTSSTQKGEIDQVVVVEDTIGKKGRYRPFTSSSNSNSTSVLDYKNMGMEFVKIWWNQVWHFLLFGVLFACFVEIWIRIRVEQILQARGL